MLGEEITSMVARTKENLADLPEIGKKIHDNLERTREKLLDAQQQTVNSALPIESLAPIGRAMSGEHVSMKSIIASLDKIVEFLLTKTPRNIGLYDSLLKMRKDIGYAAMFPPGYDVQT